MVILPCTILWSCCKHDDDNSYQEEPIQISCDVATKALIGSLPDLAAQGYSNENGIGIYGFKQNADNSFTRLFDNMRLYQTVNPQGATESTTWNWTYTPTRYWDSNPNVSYQFMAYWPRLSNTPPQSPQSSDAYAYVSVSDPGTESGAKVAKEHMIIHNFPNWQLIDGSEMDLITATKVGRYAENFKPLGGKVYLSFYHALSQLIIKAYYVGTDKKSEGGVAINGIKIYKSESGEGYLYDGPEGSKGTDFLLEYNNTRAAKPDTVSAGRNGIDIFTSEPDNGFALPWQPADTIKYRDELNDRPDFEPSYVNSWLMIPHRWHDLGLEVNYRAGNTAAKTSSKIPVTLGAETDDYYTLAGKTYVLTLIIDTSDGGVKVESLAVRQWLTHNISKEFYNW